MIASLALPRQTYAPDEVDVVSAEPIETILAELPRLAGTRLSPDYT